MKKVMCRGVHGESEEVAVAELAWRPSVYGVIIKDNAVLLSRQWDGYDFPGGGVDLGETLAEALEREIYEETGLTAQAGTRIDVFEDFFVHPVSAKKYQTLLFYYTASTAPGVITALHKDESEQYLQEAEWVPLNNVASLKFYNSVDSAALIEKAVQMQ